MKKILSIIVVAAVMSLAATSCKEAPKENAPTPEAVAETTVDPMVALCLADTSRNPIEVLERLMSQPDCPMHGQRAQRHDWSSRLVVLRIRPSSLLP